MDRNLAASQPRMQKQFLNLGCKMWLLECGTRYRIQLPDNLQLPIWALQIFENAFWKLYRGSLPIMQLWVLGKSLITQILHYIAKYLASAFLVNPSLL